MIHQDQVAGPGRDLRDITGLGTADEASRHQNRKGHQLLPPREDAVATARKNTDERRDDEPLNQVGHGQTQTEGYEGDRSPDLHGARLFRQRVNDVDKTPLRGGFRIRGEG